jgi:hypothetical protein
VLVTFPTAFCFSAPYQESLYPNREPPSLGGVGRALAQVVRELGQWERPYPVVKSIALLGTLAISVRTWPAGGRCGAASSSYP